MLEIKPLSEINFRDFIELLKQRGEAPENYYRWKYLTQVINYNHTGFVAYIDNKPVGCIGNINRTYIDYEGNEYPATWFADWYVIKSARGKGIGIELMKHVSDLSQYGFGIPGPEKAQAVAKKTGYTFQKDYYEVLVPCLPFKFGFQKHKGNILISILKGIKQLLIKPRELNIKNIKIIPIKNNFMFNNELKKNTLKRESAFINWLYLMPQKESNPRNWYIIITEKGKLLMYVERDYRNILRGRILDYINEKPFDNFITEWFLALRPTLSKMGITFFQVYIHLESTPKLPKAYYQAIPQYATFKTPPFFHLSILDKESGWRDLHLV